MNCDYFCRVKTCEILRKEGWEKIQDLEEGEIFWHCDQVPIPKIDLVDFVFTHISECIELKELHESDKEFLTDMEAKINDFIQSKYFCMKENRSKVFKVSREFLEWRSKNNGSGKC